MGYSTDDNWVHIFEGKLIEMNARRTAERWVELRKHPDNESNLHLVIYRFLNGQKANLKAEHPINGDTILGLEKGAVGQVGELMNRYVALITKTAVLRFKMPEKTCIALYDMLRLALKHSSYRVYKDGLASNQALHLTSHYVALSILEPLSLHKCWDLEDVCTVSQHDGTVSFTVFHKDMADKSTGFKEFVLKNALVAARFRSEVDSRLSQLGPSYRGRNEYTAEPSPPTDRKNRLITHPRSPSSPRKHSPLRSDHYANLTQTVELANSIANRSTLELSSTRTPLPPVPKHPPSPLHVPTLPYSTKPALPRRTHQGHPRTPSPILSTDTTGTPATPPLQRRTPSNHEPTNPQGRNYRKSVSMEEGRDRWDKFVNDFGVEEEIALMGNQCSSYAKTLKNKPPPPARRVTRTKRASIVPGRPKHITPENPSTSGNRSTPEQESVIPRSNFSLYSFLFQVWNSQEITADTLGMDLKTWSKFVIYFELLSSEMPGTINDWRGLAERIGISPMDIQVIDNYGRRFNQCASAIVMLFWQENARSLQEEYSRDVLLAILRDLERDDLIGLINGG